MAEGMSAGTVYATLALYSEDFKKNLAAANTQLGSSEKQMNKSFGRIRDGLGQTSAKLIALGTAATIGIAAMATKSALEIQKAQHAIQRETGATEAQMKSLGGSLRNVGNKISADFESIGHTIGLLNTRLGVTGKTLDDLTVALLRTGKIGNEEMAPLTNEITRLFGDWGVAAENGVVAIDKLWVTSQRTGIGVTKLAEEMVRYGAPLRQLGFEFDQAASLIGKFEAEGVNMKLVLGSMRISLGKMAREGVSDTSQALNILIQRIKEAGTTGEANAISFKVFGARAGADMAAAIREGRFEIDDLVAALGTASGAVAKTADETQTLEGKMKKLRNQVSLAVEPIGVKIVDALTKATAKMNDLTLEEKRSYLNMVMFAGGFALVVGGITKFILALPALLDGLAALKLAFTGVALARAAALLGPAALVVAPVAAIAVGGKLLGDDMKGAISRGKKNATSFRDRRDVAESELRKLYPNIKNTSDIEALVKAKTGGRSLESMNAYEIDQLTKRIKESRPAKKNTGNSNADALRKAGEAAGMSKEQIDQLVNSNAVITGDETADELLNMLTGSGKGKGKGTGGGKGRAAAAAKPQASLLETVRAQVAAAVSEESIKGDKYDLAEALGSIYDRALSELAEKVKNPQAHPAYNEIKGGFDKWQKFLADRTTAKDAADEAQRAADEQKSKLDELRESLPQLLRDIEDADVAATKVLGDDLDLAKKREEAAAHAATNAAMFAASNKENLQLQLAALQAEIEHRKATADRKAIADAIADQERQTADDSARRAADDARAIEENRRALEGDRQQLADFRLKYGFTSLEEALEDEQAVLATLRKGTDEWYEQYARVDGLQEKMADREKQRAADRQRELDEYARIVQLEKNRLQEILAQTAAIKARTEETILANLIAAGNISPTVQRDNFKRKRDELVDKKTDIETAIQLEETGKIDVDPTRKSRLEDIRNQLAVLDGQIAAFERDTTRDAQDAATKAAEESMRVWREQYAGFGDALWNFGRDRKSIGEYFGRVLQEMGKQRWDEIWKKFTTRPTDAEGNPTGGSQLDALLGRIGIKPGSVLGKMGNLNKSLPVISAVSSITGAQDKKGGAVSGASSGGLAALALKSSPLGIAASIIGGGLLGGIFGGRAERKRDAERQREIMQQQLNEIRRLNNGLIPVVDIFRSAMLNALPGGRFFGPGPDVAMGYAAATSRGVR